MKQLQKKGTSGPTRLVASEFDYFTGGKTADFAIYYNMAVDAMEGLVAKLEGKRETRVSSLKAETLIALRNYLWKGFEFNKNKAGYSITPEDGKLIELLYNKLGELRNFHSHVWHDNAVLKFETLLFHFMEEKLNVAVAAARQSFSGDDMEYFEEQLQQFPHFKPGTTMITQEGRCFFLSFFLPRGQMNSFLQQKSGSKRNDLPLYKVKREVYTYYCHADGASVTGHHLNETAFDALQTDEQLEILKARQAYKIISYLNDIPELFSDPDAIPLFLKRNGDLLPCKTVNDLVAFCADHRLFNELFFSEIGVNDLEPDEIEDKQIKGYIDFSHAQVNSYQFRISQSHFHKLVVQRILKGVSFETVFVNKLKAFAADRERLYRFMLSIYAQSDAISESDNLSADELRFFPIKGGTRLQQAYGEWLDSWLKDKTTGDQRVLNLINKIRPLQERPLNQLTQQRTNRGRRQYEPSKPEPIVLLSQYFFMGEEEFNEPALANEAIPKIRLQQKPRAENHFVRYAVRFLIDHQIVPDWHWQSETFITGPVTDKETGVVKFVNKKVKKIRSTIPQGYRLSIHDNQVVVAWKKNSQEEGKEDYWLFGLGPNALRYLLTYYILTGDKTRLNAFLNVLSKDMEKLSHLDTTNIGTVNFSLLEEQYIPAFYHKLNKRQEGVSQDQHADLLAALQRQVKQRTNAIIQRLEQAIQNQRKLRRAEKNRLIMECYQFFDWENTPDQKFLRQGEYNEMSICHYLLHDRKKFRKMYETVFCLHKRVPAIVNQLIYGAGNLDELMVSVVSAIIDMLEEGEKAINSISVPKLLKRELLPFARLLGLPVADGLLSPANLDSINEARLQTVSILPFDIHPNLVLKFFDRKKYGENYFKHNSLYKALQKEEYTKGLYADHYKIDGLEELYGVAGTNNKNEATRILQKIKGKVNTCYTEDILLWRIAREYLSKGNYTSQRATDILACLQENKEAITVKNLHTALVCFPVKKKSKPTYYILLRMHQLDDLLFQANQQKLHDAIVHYGNRKREEGVLNYQEPVSPETAISMDEVHREILRVQRDGMVVCNHLLDWEKRVITEYCSKSGAVTAQEKQALLKSKVAAGGGDEGLLHLNFRMILKLAEEAGLFQNSSVLPEHINALRVKVFHSEIPIDHSFKFQTMARPGEAPTALGSLIHIQQPIDTPKDRSQYEIQKEQ